jgi:hypothetical protein
MQQLETQPPAPAAAIPAELVAKLAEIDAQQREILHLLRGGAAMRVSYTPKEFAALIGRSTRWVQEQVEIGCIARVRGLKSTVLIPSSEIEHFRTGRAALR